MTQQEKRDLVRRYNRQPNDGIYDVYTKPSHNKINAYERIYHEMMECGGYGLKIMSFNTFMFTCAYVTQANDGSLYLIYHTPTRRDVIPM